VIEQTKLEETVKAWHTGNAYLSYKESQKITNFFGILLRIRDNKIETSLGANIPVSHAERLWKLVKLVMESGRPYRHKGHTEPAGLYTISAIETDGTLKVGCHTIKFAEIERIAKQLNLV